MVFGYDKIKTFNELEMSLYNYIIKNSDKVIYMRIRELSKNSHVSTTTILRFCKKVDCEGFSEFKLKLKMHIEKTNSKEEKLLNNTLMIIDFLKKSQGDTYQNKILKISKEFLNSDTIIFIGIGFSGIIAKYASRYIAMVGLNTLYIDDPFYPLNFTNKKNYLIVVFSISGETPTVVFQIESWKNKGCKIVSITNSEDSIISKMSDISIGYFIERERMGDNEVTTQIPAMYIIESIGKQIYQEYKKQ